VDVGVAAVFQAPTPRQLAALLRDSYDMDDADTDADGIEGLRESSPQPQ
jgi:hypothetical protein